MSRLELYIKLKTDPWYSKLFKKLRSDDLEFCVNFLNDNTYSSPWEYEFKVNRLFLDDKHKPKNHLIINEILSLCNVSLLKK